MTNKEIENFIEKLKEEGRSFLIFISPSSLEGLAPEACCATNEVEKFPMAHIVREAFNSDSNLEEAFKFMVMDLAMHDIMDKLDMEAVKRKTGVN